MPSTEYKRERYGRSRLRNMAADACRYVEIINGHAELDCPRCVQTLRTRHTGDDVHHEGGALWAVLLEHLFRECPAVEYVR